MGALHDGHLALMREARRRSAFAAASIFVNPTQFGPSEDLARYPRDLESDVGKCASAGVKLVFAPDVGEMYPPGDATRVRVSGLTDSLCGPFRPGHFEGVATVVAKLFALAAPCLVIFGRKDYQQLRVIDRMAQDLAFDVEIVGAATVRDVDGLALSSRNAYLSPEDRERARSIPIALGKAWTLFATGERRVQVLREAVAGELVGRVTRLDYATVAHPETLAALADDSVLAGPALIAVAAWVGGTRLIDNIVLGEDPFPSGSQP